MKNNLIAFCLIPRLVTSTYQNLKTEVDTEEDRTN